MFAPVYRQATVAALNAGTTTRGDYLKAYRDVERAFAAFLRRHRALRRRLVSAVLLGGDVTVRRGSDRGGVFRHVPTCTRRRPSWKAAGAKRRDRVT